MAKRERYQHAQIEKEAQAAWEQAGIYTTDLKDSSKDPYYLLVEFPYPSGDLHTGHWYAFAVTDIFARFKRMQGKNVLFPFGFDAFGLPAENAAIKRGLDPKKWTYENMETMREQIRSMGTSFDWSKEVVTCSPEYYKWTQWLFSRMYEHGLAERRNAPVKWCPVDQTVLANEQVINGHCERCGSAVEEKTLTQWFLKITQYAKRLLEDLDPLPWRDDIKDAQRAWIGESEGAKIPFKLRFEGGGWDDDWRDQDGKPAQIEIFTTRPDTIYGATYIVLAPEHPWVRAMWDAEENVATNAAEIKAYVEATTQKTERERMENKEKTGVRIEGLFATNPATGEQIPVYAADYVLATYGTGAVMAVPGHDERDFEFAKKYDLPIKDVVMPVLPDPTNPHQEGKETVHRVATINIIYDPKTDRYLTLRWKQQPWTTYVTGGVEDGEDSIEAALREIVEETGYTDVKFVRKLGGDAQAEFYAAHKGVNRVARNSLYLFELVSDAREAVSAEEEAQHEAVWIPASELPGTKFQHSESDLIKARLATGMDAYTGDGLLIDSGEFSGRINREAMWDIVAKIGGERVTNYRLRDWLVSRQRYWGCPIPVVYDPEGNPHLVPTEHLPWTLPEDVDFTPSGKSPLATSTELKERVTRIFGEGWTPEYDTLDTFVDSSWYFLRYLDPKDDHDFSDASIMKKWLPVNRYSGGSEHTTMHLLYARFFHKALFDLALVPTAEPFQERFNRGLILGPDGQKMSKSKGNVINPDEYVGKYGADAVRLYLAFIGPYNESGTYPWKPEGVEAMRRFLDRVYSLKERIVENDVEHVSSEAGMKEQRALAKAADKMGTDIERFKLNTAVSSLMILMNELEAQEQVSSGAYLKLLTLLAPFAPHLAEHLFQEVSSKAESIHQRAWPVPDASLLTQETITLGVQVAGKRRGEITLSPEASEEEAVALALADSGVAKALEGATPSRVIYVPGRILNLIP